MSIYPASVEARARGPRHGGVVKGASATGTDASFDCGSFVTFSLEIDAQLKRVLTARFQSNGCGYMIAAADVLAEKLENRDLSDLHGLDKVELRSTIDEKLGTFGDGRRHCGDCVLSAIQTAFADHRTRQIEEFRGEKALVCTCFGVTDETIESAIEQRSLKTVDDVAADCRAGSGCGSCRMLIQEMLDNMV